MNKYMANEISGWSSGMLAIECWQEKKKLVKAIENGEVADEAG